jgi:peptide/nickel transport system permease protein
MTISRTLFDNRYFTVGFWLLLIIMLLALFQPFLVERMVGDINPMEQGLFEVFAPPSQEHLLGTDRYGRDYASLVIMGLRYSLLIGLLAGTLSTVIGVVMGLVSGYVGGRVDTVLRTFTDMVLVIPALPLLIAMATFIKTVTIPMMALLLAAFSWLFAARTIRAQVLSMRERAYVDLARASGMRWHAIILWEIMPNLLPFLGVSLAASIVGAILAEFGLEVIGLGPSGIVTLGLLINWSISWGALTLGKWLLIATPAVLLGNGCNCRQPQYFCHLCGIVWRPKF